VFSCQISCEVKEQKKTKNKSGHQGIHPTDTHPTISYLIFVRTPNLPAAAANWSTARMAMVAALLL
jgi:hypothetical protein